MKKKKLKIHDLIVMLLNNDKLPDKNCIKLIK